MVTGCGPQLNGANLIGLVLEKEAAPGQVSQRSRTAMEKTTGWGKMEEKAIGWSREPTFLGHAHFETLL